MRDLDAYAKDYVDSYGFEKYQVHFRQKMLLQRLALHRPDKILEVGCGTDPLIEKIPHFTEYTVVEPIAAFLEKSRAPACGSGHVELIGEKLEDCTPALKKKEYDYIIVSSLLHELEDPEVLLSSIRSLCHARTIVHINTPNAQSLHRLIGLQLGLLQSLHDPSDTAKKYQRKHEFDLPLLKAMGEKCGFSVVDSGSYFIKPLSHQQMLFLVDNKMVSMDTLNGFFELAKDLPENGSEIFVELKAVL